MYNKKHDDTRKQHKINKVYFLTKNNSMRNKIFYNIVDFLLQNWLKFFSFLKLVVRLLSVDSTKLRSAYNSPSIATRCESLPLFILLCLWTLEQNVKIDIYKRYLMRTGAYKVMRTRWRAARCVKSPSRLSMIIYHIWAKLNEFSEAAREDPHRFLIIPAFQSFCGILLCGFVTLCPSFLPLSHLSQSRAQEAPVGFKNLKVRLYRIRNDLTEIFFYEARFSQLIFGSPDLSAPTHRRGEVDTRRRVGFYYKCATRHINNARLPRSQ